MKVRRTTEELKAANARRQKRWRDRHKWLAAERRLAIYGKSKRDMEGGPGAKTLPITKRNGVRNVTVTPSSVERVPSDPPVPVPNNFAEQTYTYDSDPEDCRTAEEKAAHDRRVAAYRRVVASKKGPSKRKDGVSEVHLKAVTDLAAIVARKKAVNVDMSAW